MTKYIILILLALINYPYTSNVKGGIYTSNPYRTYRPINLADAVQTHQNNYGKHGKSCYTQSDCDPRDRCIKSRSYARFGQCL